MSFGSGCISRHGEKRRNEIRNSREPKLSSIRLVPAIDLRVKAIGNKGKNLDKINEHLRAARPP